MNVEHVVHWMEKGSIIRTGTRLSFGFLDRGTSFGSKSAGMYLFSTFRSPILLFLFYICSNVSYDVDTLVSLCECFLVFGVFVV